MTLLVEFAALFALTLALLAAVLVTGFAHRRRLHVPLAIASLVSLVLTILAAERLGEDYDLEAAGAITPIHLAIAKVAALSFVLPIATGIATLRRIQCRRWHRMAAFTALGLTLAAVGTGTAMLLLAPLR